MGKKYKFTKRCLCCGKQFQTNSPQKLYCDDVHYIPCPICGKPVLKKDRDFTTPPRACSLECRQKLLQKNMAPVKCVICGEEFKPKSGRALICDKEHHISCSICGKDMILTKDMYHCGINTCSPECAKEKTRRFNQDKSVYDCGQAVYIS